MAGVEPITERRCTGCCGWFPLEDFPRNRRMHLGRSSRCRECHRAATKDWRDRNRERVNAERRAAYRIANPLPEKRCVVCGTPFRRRRDAIVCSPKCRQTRQNEQRRELHGRKAEAYVFKAA